MLQPSLAAAVVGSDRLCFKIDLSGSGFGVCVCGQPKSAHIGLAMECPATAASLDGPDGAAADEGEGGGGAAGRPNRRSMKAPKAAEGTYQIDVTAAVFGACRFCGQPKAAHIGPCFTCPPTGEDAAIVV